MRVDYCLPIMKEDPAKVLEAIRTHDGDYRYFEVWLDYVRSADEAFVRQLVERLGERLIILFRRQNLEAIQMSFDQRCKILELLNNTPARVDLDVTTQTAELDYAREHKLVLNTIVSYHNYQETPDAVQLTAILGTIKGYRPGTYKLATLCTKRKDALRLLEQLLALKAHGQHVIVSGMGELGTATRVFGALWGNEMTFAPAAVSGQSAPGQLTRSQLEIIFKGLTG